MVHDEYLVAAEEATSNRLQQLFLQRFQVPLSGATDTDEQHLTDVLDLMIEGRMTAATNAIIRRWKSIAIDPILKAGVELYHVAMANPDQLQQRRTAQLQALVFSNIHCQTIDLNATPVRQLVQMTQVQKQRRQAGGVV